MSEVALAEGKKGGQFYTPASVVKLLIEMLGPYEGRVFYLCCGGGGMFVQSEKIVIAHQDHYEEFPSPGGVPEGRGGHKSKVLHIDAHILGYVISRKTKKCIYEDIHKIAGTYDNWRTANGDYKNIPGFCKSVTIEEVKAFNYVLTPGRYVGLPDDVDYFNFAERSTALKDGFEKQVAEEDALNNWIAWNLSKLKIKVEV